MSYSGRMEVGESLNKPPTRLEGMLQELDERLGVVVARQRQQLHRIDGPPAPMPMKQGDPVGVQRIGGPTIFERVEQVRTHLAELETLTELKLQLV
jgi:hypothetical protein